MKKIGIVLLLFLFPMKTIWAIKISNLYAVELPVISQTQENKEEAIRSGFLQVLIKLTGDPLIDKNPLIKKSLQKADYYVQEFGYASANTHSSTYLLQIRYDHNSINRLLKKAGVVYWGEIRPLILVWLAVTNKKHQTEIIGNEVQGKISLNVKQEGKKFGLPLIFPMMDMSEINQIPVTAVIEKEISFLKAASKRYSPDALLIGHIEESKQGLQSEWLLNLKDNNQWNWTVHGKTTEEVVSFVLDQVSQTLAKHYVSSSGKMPKAWYKMEVSHIKNHPELIQLMQSLKALPPVLDIQLAEISGDNISLSVLVRGSLTLFEQHAALNHHLIAKQSNQENNQLAYEWS